MAEEIFHSTDLADYSVEDLKNLSNAITIAQIRSIGDNSVADSVKKSYDMWDYRIRDAIKRKAIKRKESNLNRE